MLCYLTAEPGTDAGFDTGLDGSGRDGAAPHDGSPLPDTGSVGTDAGMPAIDTGVPEDDTGVPGVDSGMLATDSGIVSMPDTGTPAIDSGTGIDSATPAVDGGMSDGGGPCSGLPYSTFYRDLDGDGHGAASGGTMMRCGPGAGYVASNDDCDDTSATRYPGAAELCNGVDDDCDTTIDGAAADARCSSSLPHVASATCSAGACLVGVCATGYGDCDATDSNGCEISTTSDPAHCGGCGAAFACDAALSCAASTCEVSHVVDVALGVFQGCARRANGRVACWGATNTYGQLGDTSSVGPGPVAVMGITNATNIASSFATACAVLASGAVWCWGEGDHGELGRGSPIGAVPNAPAAVFGITNAVEVAMSHQSACARLSTGRVACWGSSLAGDYLGGGVSGHFSDSPVMVMGLNDAVDLTENANQGYCAARASGGIVCWGRNSLTATAWTTTPALSTITNAVGVGMTTDTLCGVLAGGAVSCVVISGTGESPSSSLSSTAQAVGGDVFLCAQSTGGALSCWGVDQHGELGRGHSGFVDLTPAAVTGLSSVVDVDANSDAVCAASSSGSVYCWGYNLHGQLSPGIAIGSLSSTPARITGL